METIKTDPYIEQIANIAKKLNTKIYLVGGAVRDALLGRHTNDYDFVVFGDLEKLAKAINREFICKTVGYKKKISTYRIFCSLKTIDLSEPRESTLEKDLLKRDFTINSMACDFQKDILIDPLGGFNDIERKIIKANSDSSIDDDPLRIMRGFRLAAQFRFDIESKTLKLFSEKIELLKKISKERITDELKLFFNLNETFAYLLIMDKVGLIDTLFEDLSLTNGCLQSSKHLYDVKTHSLNVYNYVEWALVRMQKILGKTYKRYMVHFASEKELLLPSLKLAALFHDSGKPFTKVVIDGKTKFPEHEKKSSEIFEKYAEYYTFGKKITKLTKFFIEKHIEPSNIYRAWSIGELGDDKKIDFFLDHGEYGIDLLFFALADTLAKGKIRASKREVYITFLKEMTQFYYSIEQNLSKKPIINGKDILKRYPRIDKRKINSILKQIKKLQLLKAISTKEEAIKILPRMV